MNLSSRVADHYFRSLEASASGTGMEGDTNDMLEEFIGFLKPATDPSPHHSSSSGDDAPFLAVSVFEALAIVIPALIIMLFTIIGNCLVIAAVFTYRPLKQSQNMYMVSLAVADITVAMFVMPFNVIYSIRGRWDFGLDTCKAWLTFDIMCCTASILNLCAIALDRYQAIHDPINYAQKRTLRRVLIGILLVWLISALISIPPLLGWNDWPETFTATSPCTLTSEKGFVVYSSSGSFFIPLIIMSIVYIKIFVATRRRLRARTTAATNALSDMKATMSHVKDGRTQQGSVSDPRDEESELVQLSHIQLQQQGVKGPQNLQPLHRKQQLNSSAKSGSSSSNSACVQTVMTRFESSSSSRASDGVTWHSPAVALPAQPQNKSRDLTAGVVDHCPVSVVKIAIEKNSSSISSSQDDFTLIMPPVQSNASHETNGRVKGRRGRDGGGGEEEEARDETRDSMKNKGRRFRSMSPSDSRKNGGQKESNSGTALTADQEDGVISSRDDEGTRTIVDANHSEAAGRRFTPSHWETDGPLDGKGSHNPITDSGHDVVEAESSASRWGEADGEEDETMDDAAESSHHKRMIEPSCNTRTSRSRHTTPDESKLPQIPSLQQIQLETKEEKDEVRNVCAIPSSSVSASSRVNFDRRKNEEDDVIDVEAAIGAEEEDGEEEEANDARDDEDRDDIIFRSTMDQTVTRLSVPGSKLASSNIVSGFPISRSFSPPISLLLHYLVLITSRAAATTEG